MVAPSPLAPAIERMALHHAEDGRSVQRAGWMFICEENGGRRRSDPLLDAGAAGARCAMPGYGGRREDSADTREAHKTRRRQLGAAAV